MSDGKAGTPKATVLLAGALALAAALGGVSTDIGQLHRLGARPPLWGFHPQPVHLIAPLFLHFGWLHWLCNLLSLVTLALGLEAMLGGAAVLFLFFFSGILSISVSLHMQPQVTALGCSGAVFGLLGAHVVHGWWPPRHRDRWRWTALASLAVGIAAWPRGLPIDHSAHWGGLLAGVVGYACWRLGPLTRSLALAGLAAWLAWECRSPRLPL